MAHTPEFLEWGLGRARRSETSLDRTFPFGYDGSQPADAPLHEARRFWDSLGIVGDRQLVVCFLGALAHQVDLEAVFEAASLVEGDHSIHFVFCGAGESLAEFRRRASSVLNMTFVGWVDLPYLWELLRRASIGLVPIKSNPDFLASVPNKVPEYLSAGLPLAVTFQRGVVYDLIASSGAGFSYSNRGHELASRLALLRKDPSELSAMRKAATDLFEARFRADVVYRELVAHLETIVDAYAGQKDSGRHPAL